MSKESAGILVYRRTSPKVEVLLVHPAGPIYGHKDVWSIPKGELDDGEDHLLAAFREFQEEVGVELPHRNLTELGSSKQKSGKTNYIWAMEADLDVSSFSCETFTMEWPPQSGTIQEFPENDRADWFDLVTAKTKLFLGQVIFIDRLAAELEVNDQTEKPQQSLL